MRPAELTAGLAGFERRGPGTDAERRAARWLSRELRADAEQVKAGDQKVKIEPFWCRPDWALAHAWHVALALAGSLLSVSHPVIGAACLTAALVSIVSDALIGVSPGRRLTPERASQNVVVSTAPPGNEPPIAQNKPATLVVTANYDAGRTALVYRDPLRRPAAALRRIAGPLALGWLGCVAIAILWLLATAVIRITANNPPSALGAVQLAPSIGLVLALALLLEAAGAAYGPAAGDNASGTAAAVALVRVLKDRPPHNVGIELVLQGAGEGNEIGLRSHLRTHRRPHNTIVLGIAPCGSGEPHWWESDGRLIPIPYSRRIRALARATANDLAQPHRGRGGTPASPATTRRLPAIAIGNLDPRGLAPRSHQRNDTPRSNQRNDTPETADGNSRDGYSRDGYALDGYALDRAVELGLSLVHAIDAALEPEPATSDPAATPA